MSLSPETSRIASLAAAVAGQGARVNANANADADADADAGVEDDGHGPWRRAAFVLAWVAGVALQLRQEDLWPGASYPLLAAAGLAAVLAGGRLRRARCRSFSLAVSALAVMALGFGYAGWRADLRLADALAPEWEGCDIELTGTIDEMPQSAEDGQHFAFAVESARPLAMTAQDLRRVAALDAAAGAPLSPEVLVAESPRGGVGGDARERQDIDAPDDGGELGDAEVLDAAVPIPVPAGSETGAGAGAAPRPPPPASPRVPSHVWLAWNRNQRDDPAVAAAPAPLRAGQRWRLSVRLRLPHGAMNPDGFDAELWLFDQGLRATGVVRGNGVLLSEGWAPIEGARQWVRDRLLLSGADGGVGQVGDRPDAQTAGTLAALAVGDQAAIDGAGWEVFRNTGVAHLMSISGLHITMLGWLAARAVGALWRRSERASTRVATPVAARWGGVLAAWLYALLAGWGVPARRTVIMLASTALLRSVSVDWPPALVTLAAMGPVTLLDPWALLQPGFWLSFAAVGLLMVAEPARHAAATFRPTRLNSPSGESGGGRWQAVVAGSSSVRRGGAWLLGELSGGLRAQVVASVGLAPLTLVAFQQFSPVGLLANVVAEPWVTLVVTPLTLLGVVVPALWQVAALALRPLLWWLGVLNDWHLASLHVATAPGWALVAGLAGGALFMLPIPWRLRVCGVAMLPPLVVPFVARPAPGRFELVAADVGQGSAVLVRTRTHLLLFDTGPRFGEGDDAGRRLLLPLLQARGESGIDTLVLSHADADHVGGAQSLIDRLPVRSLRSSLEAGHPLRANPIPHTPCEAGQSWTWDGVDFAMLHPFPGDLHSGAKTNAVSCVLRVSDAAGRSALLTGDVEAPQEAALVGRSGAALRSDVLVVPHHGSKTSSTATFLEAVRPRVAVIQVGYRSRYGHPAPEVLARYGAHGIPVVRTDHCGAWSWRGDETVCTRAVRRRYWSWAGPRQPPVPLRIAAFSAASGAGSDVAKDSTGTPRGAASRMLEGAAARHEFAFR